MPGRFVLLAVLIAAVTINVKCAGQEGSTEETVTVSEETETTDSAVNQANGMNAVAAVVSQATASEENDVEAEVTVFAWPRETRGTEKPKSTKHKVYFVLHCLSLAGLVLVCSLGSVGIQIRRCRGKPLLPRFK